MARNVRMHHSHPPHSTQAAPPILLANHTSTSADGSVKGGNGRIRIAQTARTRRA